MRILLIETRRKQHIETDIWKLDAVQSPTLARPAVPLATCV